jgi:hypothetical protein
MPHEGHTRKQNQNKLKFSNTKLGLPSLNEAKSKEGHPLLIHSFSSLNPSSKWLFFCVSILSPTTTNQKVLQFLWPKLDLHKILNFRYHSFCCGSHDVLFPTTWMDGCIVSFKDIQSFYGTSSLFKSVFSLVWEVLQFDPLLVKTKGIDVKYSRSRDLMVVFPEENIHLLCSWSYYLSTIAFDLLGMYHLQTCKPNMYPSQRVT